MLNRSKLGWHSSTAAVAPEFRGAAAGLSRLTAPASRLARRRLRLCYARNAIGISAKIL
jgi:hypothetical protein